jgi:hypothetical protein
MPGIRNQSGKILVFESKATKSKTYVTGEMLKLEKKRDLIIIVDFDFFPPTK